MRNSTRVWYANALIDNVALYEPDDKNVIAPVKTLPTLRKGAWIALRPPAVARDGNIWIVIVFEKEGGDEACFKTVEYFVPLSIEIASTVVEAPPAAEASPNPNKRSSRSKRAAAAAATPAIPKMERVRCFSKPCLTLPPDAYPQLVRTINDMYDEDSDDEDDDKSPAATSSSSTSHSTSNTTTSSGSSSSSAVAPKEGRGGLMGWLFG